MATDTEAFLRAEESVNQLLGSLERLKAEVQGYSKAKGALEDARGHVAALAETLGRTADQAASVMNALEQIGTPQILKEIESVALSNEKTVATLDVMEKQLVEAFPNLESNINKALEKYDASNRKGDSAVLSQMTAQVTGLTNHINTVTEKISQDVAVISKGLQHLSNTVVLIGVAVTVLVLLLAVFR